MSPRVTSEHGLPYFMNLRLSEIERRYLLLLAARDDVPMTECVRRLIDKALARERVVTDELDIPEEARSPSGSLPLRTVLELADDSAFDELREQYGGQD
jgi:hypothetical protein